MVILMLLIVVLLLILPFSHKRIPPAVSAERRRQDLLDLMNQRGCR